MRGPRARPAVVMRLLAAVAAAMLTAGCLVLNVNPLYDDDTLTWEPGLLGAWQDVDDKASMQIERGEWKSYSIRYVHPIETGHLTGYLTAVGDARYLDVMPARGEDRGSFLIPVHAFLRVGLDGDRLELTPMSYDWMSDRLKAATPPPGLDVAFDQKENALIVSPTARLRAWIRRQALDGPMFGASAIFSRVRQSSGRRPSDSNYAQGI
jgi:hypothetical protein